MLVLSDSVTGIRGLDQVEGGLFLRIVDSFLPNSQLSTKKAGQSHYVTFQLAEVAAPGNLFREILRLVDGLRPRPPTRC